MVRAVPRLLGVSLVSAQLIAALALPAVAQFAEEAVSRIQGIQIVVESDARLRGRLERMRGQPLPPLPLFWDLDQREWYAPYVEVAFLGGVLPATPDRQLRAYDTLTIDQAVLMRARQLGRPEAEGESEDAMEVSVFAELTRQLAAAGVTVPPQYKPGDPVNEEDFRALFALPGSGSVQEPPVDAAPDEEPQPEAPQAQPTGPFTAPIRPEDLGLPPQDLPVQEPIPQEEPVEVDPPTEEEFEEFEETGQVPPRDALPSLQGSGFEQYASAQPFAITMPSLGITDLKITHPTDSTSASAALDVLNQGVGHLFSYPGDGGKILVYGHSSNWPWDVSGFAKIFRRVNELNPGDQVFVTYNGRLYVYQVVLEETIAARDTLSLQSEDAGEQIILYTCWPPDDITHRYLVRAAPVAVYQI